MDLVREHAIREAMFGQLDLLVASSPDGALGFEDTASFEFMGERIVMRQVRGRGIHKPRQLAAALSITTAFSTSTSTRPYDDEIGPDGYQRYKYQGADPNQSDNASLREAMLAKLPLVYFLGVAPARYKPIYPVYVIGDFPELLEVALGFHVAEIGIDLANLPGPERVYAAREVKQRLHQPRFREQVLTAYRRSCSICRLRHEELLDAAHIIGDSQPNGDPIVPNGLSLCKIHHAAYDRNLIGIRPDSVIEVNHRLLDEVDGPMLKHGIQEMHKATLVLPERRQDRPDPERLAVRFDAFEAAS